MQYDSSQIASRMSEKINDLLGKRQEHLAIVSDIETQLKRAFQALGIDPSEFGIQDGAPSRLSRGSVAQRYPLDPNTMGGHMIGVLEKANRGFTRRELRAEIEKEPRYGAQIAKNMNVYYNLINRYLTKGRIVDVGGFIYHPDRAPLPEGEEDPTGQHLPNDNVSNLFSVKRNIDV